MWELIKGHKDHYERDDFKTDKRRRREEREEENQKPKRKRPSHK